MYGFRTTAAAVQDVLREYTGQRPYYLPVWGDYPDELPALATPGSKEGHGALAGAKANDPRVNRCAARVFLQIGRYRPVAEAEAVDCPALVVRAAHDQLASKSAIGAAVSSLPDARVVTVDADHFGAFSGDLFEEVVEREGAFLERHLLGDGERASEPTDRRDTFS